MTATRTRFTFRLPGIDPTNPVSFRFTGTKPAITSLLTTTTTTTDTATPTTVPAITISSKPSDLQSSGVKVAVCSSDTAADGGGSSSGVAADSDSGEESAAGRRGGGFSSRSGKGGASESGGECGRGQGVARGAVGRYVIDTPRDPAQALRQNLLSFQLSHRGVRKTKNNRLPEIPYRLTQKPDLPQPAAMNRPPPILKVDVATSPMDFPHEDLNLNSSRTLSPSPSTARSVTFMTEPEVFSEKVQDRQEVQRKKEKSNSARSRSFSQSVGQRRSSRDEGSRLAVGTNKAESLTKEKTAPSSVTKSVSFSQQTEKAGRARSVRECSKLTPIAFENPVDFAHSSDHFADFADSPRGLLALRLCREKSSSLSDITDFWPESTWSLGDRVGSASYTPRSRQWGNFSYTPRSEVAWDSSGAGHVLEQYHRPKSLLDMLKEQDGVKAADPTAYHKKLRIAHLAFRRDNALNRGSAPSYEKADKEWMDMISENMMDGDDYDKFASRRKPTKASYPGKTAGNTSMAKSGTEFKLSQPANGKVFPVFFNDGLPVRKFGRIGNTYKRRPSKSKS